MHGGARRRRIALPGRGVELEVYDWGGDGPLAILSHANGFCAAIWEPIAERLRERFRVLGYDSRGHGDSSKPDPADGYAWPSFTEDLIALAEHLAGELDVPRVEYAIGHSFGGTFSLAAAARRPDLFARIALLDPVLVPPRPSPQLPASADRRKQLGAVARRRRHVWPSREVVRASWRGREPFEDWDPRSFELYLAHGFRDRSDGQVELKCPGEVEACIYETEARIDAVAAAEKLEVPALAVRATRGNFPRELFDELCAAAPSLRLVELDAGHLLPMTQPERVAELLLEFAGPV